MCYNNPMKVTKHREYWCWIDVRRRCLKPHHKEFPNYGGRGITIAEEWINDAEPFLTYLDEVLGERPDGFLLDRIDNDGNYEPGNLRWASPSLSVANRRPLKKKPHKRGVEIGGHPNSHGLKWVRQQASGRFQGIYNYGGKKITVGTFDTPEEAHQAVLQHRANR